MRMGRSAGEKLAVHTAGHGRASRVCFWTDGRPDGPLHGQLASPGSNIHEVASDSTGTVYGSEEHNEAQHLAEAV
jgi:hypothetical protein